MYDDTLLNVTFFCMIVYASQIFHDIDVQIGALFDTPCRVLIILLLLFLKVERLSLRVSAIPEGLYFELLSIYSLYLVS